MWALVQVVPATQIPKAATAPSRLVAQRTPPSAVRVLDLERPLVVRAAALHRAAALEVAGQLDKVTQAALVAQAVVVVVVVLVL